MSGWCAGRVVGTYAEDMPRYDYRCRVCGTTFELDRPMAAAGEPTSCPDGHDDTVKLLHTAGLTAGRAAPAPAAGGGSEGGCCGGGCCA